MNTGFKIRIHPTQEQITTKLVKTKPIRIVMEDLKLKDRTYHCSNCGLVIDRDIKAAINLANYTN